MAKMSFLLNSAWVDGGCGEMFEVNHNHIYKNVVILCLMLHYNLELFYVNIFIEIEFFDKFSGT